MASIEPSAGSVVLTLDAAEAGLLRDLASQMEELLARSSEYEDPVVDRLFPSAYEDPKDSQAYSDLIGDELKKAKLDALRSVLSVLGEPAEIDTTVPRSEVDAWLTVLTDLRLALGTRLEVTEEKMEAELDPADPGAAGIAVLHWLGWVQEMFIRAITEVGDDGPAGTG